jgi:hypothetical protein
MSVKDSNNKLLFANRNMEFLSAGLFGYKASSGELNIETEYRSIVNCTSTEYGSGLSDSRFKIISSAIEINNEVSTPIADSSVCTFGDVGCYLRDAVNSILALPKNILSYIWNTVFIDTGIYPNILKPMLDFILDKSSGLGSIISSLINILWTFIHLTYVLFTNPTGFFSDIVIPFIFSVGFYIFITYFLIVGILEAVIIGYVVMAQNKPNTTVFDLLYNYFYFHYKLIEIAWIAVYSIIMGLITMLSSIVRLFSFIRQIFQI